MAHYYEKIAVENRKEYTRVLLDALTPLIYEGILNIYIHAKLHDKQMMANTGKSTGVIETFQSNLENITKLSEEKIQNELERIRTNSKCADYFDDLIKATIKSNIILYTFKASSKRSEIVESKYHENISISNFIHKCYIAACRNFYNMPYLFWDKLPYTPIIIKKNQKEIFIIIEKSIKEAIRQMLPLRLILTEYLQDDYSKDEDTLNITVTRDDYERVKYLLDESRKIEDIKNISADGLVNYNNGNHLGLVHEKNIRGGTTQIQNPWMWGSIGSRPQGSIFVSDDSSDLVGDNLFEPDNSKFNIIKMGQHGNTIANPPNNIINVPQQYHQQPNVYAQNLQLHNLPLHNGSIHDVPPNAPKIFNSGIGQNSDSDSISKSNRITHSNNKFTDQKGKNKEKEKEKEVEVQYIKIDDEGGKRPTNFNFVGNTKNKLAERFGIVIDAHKEDKDIRENSRQKDKNRDRDINKKSSDNHKNNDSSDKNTYFARYK